MLKEHTMPEDLKKEIVEYTVTREQIVEKKKNFKNYNEMFRVLEADAQRVKKSLLTEEEQKNLGNEDGNIPVGKLPKLPKLAVANIFRRHIDYCTFSSDEMSRIAIYIPMEGIYTQNYGLVKKIISYIEPALTENQAETVIYFLKNRATIREPIHSGNLISVSNGIYNIKKKALDSFSPEYVFTAKIATKYVENPTPPNINGWTFDGWLRSIACNDEQLVNIMWQAINECCNGNHTRRKAIFLVGNIKGNNGKGTFQDLIENLVGRENTANLKVNEFDQRFRLATLENKTVCIGDDAPANIYIKDSSNFNSIVTGDPVTIERKGKDAYSTRLMCTVIQSCNGMPTFHNKGGTMRRLLIIPFNANFNDKTDKEEIKFDYLRRKEVLEYVLYRALQLDFKKFDIPEAAQTALHEFELDNDPLVSFKETFFDENNIEKIPAYHLYDFYKKYCLNNGYKPLSNIRFVRQFLQIAQDYEKKVAKYSMEDIENLKSLSEDNQLVNYERIPINKKSYNSFIKKV
ncbi:DNA primase family protein [Liquorilactobacillus capillatus]|nr:DNA primase family protein [Liquorilactobacillus capillatus]